MSNRDRMIYERAEAVPGRSLTRSKAPGRFYDIESGLPLFAVGGKGSKIDVGRDAPMLDMVCALGAMVLGYDAADDAYAPRASNPSVYSLPTQWEGDAAQAIKVGVAPWATRVRFLKTGSEATHAAYRIAKAATGRKHVLVGDWAYHGWHEWCDDRTFPFTHRFGHEEELMFLEDAFHDDRQPPEAVDYDDIAAVFIEPHRWKPTNIEWLRKVRKFCDLHGIVLVFDEMIYGCRWAMGGATEYFGVQPDLACYGKAIANGHPLACVVGGSLMETFGEIPSGTYSGHAEALAACARTLWTLGKIRGIETLWKRGRQLRRGLNAVVDELGLQSRVFVEGAGDVHMRLRFKMDGLKLTFAAGMASRDVLWHPDVVNVSTAHSEADIECAVNAAEESLREMVKAGVL